MAKGQSKIGSIQEMSLLELRKRYNEILLIQKISNTIVQNLDFEQIAQGVVDSIVNNLNYLGGVLFLVEGEKIRSYNFSQTRIMNRAVKPVSNIFRNLTTSLLREENLVGRTIIKDKMIEGSDVSKFISPPVSASLAKLMQRVAGVKSIVTVPIHVKGNVVGAMMFVTSENAFSKIEKEMLKTFSDQTGIAIENARLYQKITNFNNELKQKVADATDKIQGQYQDLLVLRKITDVITSTLDLQKVCQEIVNSVTSRLNFIAGLINLIDANTYQLYPIAFSENLASAKLLSMLGPLHHYRLSVDEKENLLARAANTMKVQVTDNIKEVLCPPLDNRIAQKMQKMNCITGIIVLPIIAQGRVLGTLSIGLDKSSRLISDSEKQTMQILAKEAGLAIDNALLFQKSQLFNEQLKQEVSRATWELRNANKKLTKLDQAKSEFISIASHQLRTPLSTIKGYLAMILDGDYGIVSEEVARVLSRVYNSNERLVALVNNMLNVSRIESGRIKFDPRPIEIAPLIETVINELAPEIRAQRIEVIFKNPKRKLRLVRADKRLVHEIVFNLVDNAIKYTQRGKVEISLSKRDYGLETKIKDTGVGIAAADMAHLFRKFTRGRDAYRYYTGGSGLGLFVVKKLVEMNGGEISASSHGPGKGSTFRFTIPYA